MNSKKTIFILVSLFIIIIGIIYFFYRSSNSKENNISKDSVNSSDYSTSKLSTNNSTSNTLISSENNSNNNSKNSNVVSNENSTQINDTNSANNFDKDDTSKNTPPKETEIASFSTKIYTKDSERQNNVSITCSKLNDTIVENGKTFSFCNTVGKATSSEGYQKADVFKDGEKIKALGGGNCQVSTTLYNAVLKIPELKVTERHAHSNSVPYIKEGKDAAVSYGTYDLKFVNNTRKFYKDKMQYR